MPMFLRSALFAFGALFALGAAAQPGPDEAPPGDASDQPDPPSRVARLSFIRGAVSFVPAGENDWVEAQLNRPLITGDKLYTDRGSRAELEIGSAALRIDEGTSFDFLNLDDQAAQVELTEGALNLRVRRLYDNQVYEIDTPTLAFVVDRVGEYRVTVAPDGDATVVAVMRGSGDAYGEGGARLRVEEGQAVTFRDSQLRDYDDDALPAPDAFDAFIAQRDERWDHARSRQYVSEDVIGYEDLDDNGEWDDVPEYGHVWYPTTVDVGWTPYHDGHWGWVGAYGWTWIDDASWGFAPFHYGRWANVRGRWGWCPGPIAVRPYYAPALVAFIGGGVTVSVGGPVGWFPLGPRDVYFPGYHVSRGYFTRVNVSNTIVNTTVIDNYYGGYARGTINYADIGYRNRAIAGAVVAVPAAAFVAARPVRTAAIAVNRDTFANARVSSFAAVAPTRQSLAASTARAAHAPPSTAFNRPIVAASKPPAPVAPFAAREAMLQKNPGRPLGVRELHAAAGTTMAQPAAAGRSGAAAGRANVKVVTRGGTPLRTPAAPVVSRGDGVNAGAGRNAGGGDRRGAGSANANAASSAGAANADARRAAAAARADGRDANAPGAGRGNAAGVPQNPHLQSSRFAHGNGNDAANDDNGRGANGARPGRGNATPPEAARAASDRGERPGAAERSVAPGRAPAAAPPGSARANDSDGGRGNANRNPAAERMQRPNPGDGNNQSPTRGNAHAAPERAMPARVPPPDRPPPARPPQARDNDAAPMRRAPPQQEAQRVQPPPQYQQRVQPPPPPPRVEQPPPQYRQPPPQAQPQRGPPANRGQEQSHDKRKKDDDKKNGGGR